MKSGLIRLAVPAAAGLCLLGGCALEQAVSARPATVLPVLNPADGVKVEVHSTTSDFALFDSDAQRVANRIHEQFTGAAAASETPAPRYKVDVVIVNYDKGNNYIRAMLAGLGQIHTDTQVRVFALPGNTEVSRFTVSTTFDIGGIYGSASRIQDIEAPFVQAVVTALRNPAAASSDAHQGT